MRHKWTMSCQSQFDIVKPLYLRVHSCRDAPSGVLQQRCHVKFGNDSRMIRLIFGGLKNWLFWGYRSHSRSGLVESCTCHCSFVIAGPQRQWKLRGRGPSKITMIFPTLPLQAKTGDLHGAPLLVPGHDRAVFALRVLLLETRRVRESHGQWK